MSANPGSAPLEVTLRRALPADAADAAGLWIAARRAAALSGSIPAPVHRDMDVRRWFSGAVVAHKELWLAEHEQHGLAGIMVLDGEWLEQLYVRPGLEGRGVGAALIRRAIGERTGGLRLWVFLANTRAIAFYARHGFTEVRRTDGSGNEERSPDAELRWSP